MAGRALADGPLVLCGPPGSGKTMTLFCALQALPDFEVSLNEQSLAAFNSTLVCKRLLVNGNFLSRSRKKWPMV